MKPETSPGIHSEDNEDDQPETIDSDAMEGLTDEEKLVMKLLAEKSIVDLNELIHLR